MDPRSGDERGRTATGNLTDTIGDAQRAAFAEVSGDHNPIHTDPVAARRLHGGRMLVHGAHVLLTVIDRMAREGSLRAAPSAIDVRFLHGVEPDADLVTTLHAPSDGDRLRATVRTGVWDAAEVTLTAGDLAPSERALAAGAGGPRVADDVDLDALGDRRGRFELVADARAVTRLLPHATGLLGAERTVEIAALSRVVGMHAPGLRSMSSRYRIEVGAPRRPPEITYAVARVDPRMGRTTIGVTGPSITATVDAFTPSGPVDQTNRLAGGARPSAGEFAGRRVLVVGGSRGLGAATVALLAAGGADVRFTYRVGVAEAAAVTAATGAPGSRFDAPHDALPTAVEGGSAGWGRWHPTELCWFATPPYTGGTGRAYSERLRDELLAVQVDAFERAVDGLRPLGLVAALWPSTALVDSPTPDTRERVDVARAGEQAVARLGDRRGGFVAHAPRFPGLLTDQTVSLMPTEYADTASCLLTALRELLGARR